MYNRSMAATIVFSTAQFDQMAAHVLSDPTCEMCGLLAGREGRVDRVLPVPNVLHSPEAYRMDGSEFAEAMAACEFEPLGIFHSHIAGPSAPSPTDIAQAMYPDSIYIVISLHPLPPGVRAFRIIDRQVSDVEIVIDPEPMTHRSVV